MTHSLIEKQNEIFILKTELSALKNEIFQLKNDLHMLKNNYGYNTFLSEVHDSETETTLSSGQTTATGTEVRALTVIKSQSLLDLGKTTKEVGKFSLKSLFISLALTLFNLFI